MQQRSPLQNFLRKRRLHIFLNGLSMAASTFILCTCGVATEQDAPATPTKHIIVTSENWGDLYNAHTTVAVLDTKNGKENWHRQQQGDGGFLKSGLSVASNGVLYTVENQVVAAPTPDPNEVSTAQDITVPGGAQSAATATPDPNKAPTATPGPNKAPTGFISAQRLNDGKQLWQAHIGFNPSTPLVHDDVVYVSTFEGFNQKHPYAFNSHDGKQLWSTVFPGEFFDTLQLANGNLYVLSNQICLNMCDAVALFSFDAASGKLIWHQKVPSSSEQNSFLISKHIVFLAIKDNTNALYIYDTTSGKKLAQYTAADIPTIIGDAVYAILLDRKDENDPGKYTLATLDSGNGHVLRRTVIENVTLMTHDDSAFYGLKTRVVGEKTIVSKGATGNAPIYAYSLVALRMTDGQHLWETSLPKPVRNLTFSNGVLYGNTITLLDNSGEQEMTLFALNARNGTERWQKSYQIHGDPRYSFHLDNDILYAVGSSNTLLAINVRDGSLQWQKQTDGAVIYVSTA